MHTDALHVVDRMLRQVLVATSLLCIASQALADSSNDASGASDSAVERERVAADVPRSEYPAPGEQPPPGDCRLLPAVPQAALLLRRGSSGGVDRVTAEEAVQAEALVWIFNIAAGAVIREVSLHGNAHHE